MGKFGCWFSIRINLVERPVICLVQYKEIFKQYLFTNKMWTHKGKFWIVPNYKVYGVMIFSFQSQVFGLRYKLKVLDLQNIN